jgi:CDP-diacylglycerol--glycerol-3-phosphate 3-phosphatidyltransferase
VDPRDSSPIVRGWLRLAYRIGRLLARFGIRPAALTWFGLLVAVLVPVVTQAGRAGPIAGGVLVVVSAMADSADGALAVVTNRVTRLGYVYDSVADRLAEVAWLVAFWLLGVPSWVVVLGGGLTWLQEYVRARATAAGMTEIGVVTVSERSTRAIIVSLGLVAAGVAEFATRDLSTGTVTMAAAVWLLLGAIGLGQLTVAVHDAFAEQAKDRSGG